MKILAVGGGSGGHVTPVAAVLNELIVRDASLELRVWTDRSFYSQTVRTMKQVDAPVKVDKIMSGKFRRYHSLPLYVQLTRLRAIVLPNIRDSFYIAAGFFQSIIKLTRWRPDVIFCKGGFVCLPVGVAARVLRIPIVLHDSDVHPGLANRVLSKWAVMIGTGMPSKYYSYPKQRMRYVGVPINKAYQVYAQQQQLEFKKQLGFDAHQPLVVVTGGGLGSETLNTVTAAVARELSDIANVYLITGKRHHAAVIEALKGADTSKVKAVDFVYENMVEVLAAADVVVTRAGATTLLELAALAKPTVLIPSPYLTGGHQLKNALMYQEKSAAVVLDEHSVIATPHELLDTLNALLLNPAELVKMSRSIHEFSKPNAAAAMADCIIDAVGAKK